VVQGLSVNVVPSSESALSDTTLLRRKEHQVRNCKDLNACIAQLQAMLRRNDMQPEQKSDVEKILQRLRKFRRKPNPTRAETFREIRSVTDLLLKAFVK